MWRIDFADICMVVNNQCLRTRQEVAYLNIIKSPTAYPNAH